MIILSVYYKLTVQSSIWFFRLSICVWTSVSLKSMLTTEMHMHFYSLGSWAKWTWSDYNSGLIRNQLKVCLYFLSDNKLPLRPRCILMILLIKTINNVGNEAADTPLKALFPCQIGNSDFQIVRRFVDPIWSSSRPDLIWMNY